jgi:hypothetical protein
MCILLEIILILSAWEAVFWVDQDRNSHSGRHDYFQEEINLLDKKTQFGPGVYTFPFRFHLPFGLPGTSVIDYKSEMKYNLHAEMYLDKFKCSDLAIDCEVQVFHRILQEIIPVSDSIQEDVLFMCCFRRGKCILSASLKKNLFARDETIDVRCEINNASSVPIKLIHCSLIMDVVLQSDDGRKSCGFYDIFEREFAGIPAKTFTAMQLTLPLKTRRHPIYPSTTGTYFGTKYFIEVECEHPWSDDIYVRLPITLTASASDVKATNPLASISEQPPRQETAISPPSA